MWEELLEFFVQDASYKHAIVTEYGFDYKEPVEIKNVRIERKDVKVVGKDGNFTVGSGFLIIYIPTFSSGMDDIFTENSKIEYMGREYTIKSVDIIPFFDTLHYEMRVV